MPGVGDSLQIAVDCSDGMIADCGDDVDADDGCNVYERLRDKYGAKDCSGFFSCAWADVKKAAAGIVTAVNYVPNLKAMLTGMRWRTV